MALRTARCYFKNLSSRMIVPSWSKAAKIRAFYHLLRSDVAWPQKRGQP